MLRTDCSSDTQRLPRAGQQEDRWQFDGRILATMAAPLSNLDIMSGDCSDLQAWCYIYTEASVAKRLSSQSRYFQISDSSYRQMAY